MPQGVQGPPACLSCRWCFQDTQDSPRMSRWVCYGFRRGVRYLRRYWRGLPVTWRPKWCPRLKENKED